MNPSARPFIRQSGRGLLGCLGVCFLLLVALGLAIELDRRQAATQVLGLVQEHLGDAVRASRLPEDQKIEAHRQIDRIFHTLKEAGLNEQETRQVQQRLSLRPVWGLLMLWYADQKLVQDSPAPEELKRDSAHQIRRLATGVYADLIDPNALREVYTPALREAESPRDPSPGAGGRFVEAMRHLADRAQIAEVPWEIDFPDLLRRARTELETLLARPTAPPETDPAPAPLRLEHEP